MLIRWWCDERVRYWLPVGIVALGVVARIVFFAVAPWHSGGGEAENIAIALAHGRGFADTYFVGSGPTAHLTPTTPLIAGFVYRALGVHTPAATAVLMGWSLACFAGSALLLNRLFDRLGCALPERAAALAAMCFLPVFLVHETIVFQFGEGQVVFMLMLLSLIHMVDDRVRRPTMRRTIIAALLNGATVLINPICGAAVIVAQLSAFARGREIGRAVIHLALVGAIVVPPVALWAARNEAVLGAPILFRDNLGMELSFKNNDAILQTGPSYQAVTARWNAIHPDGSAAAMRSMRAVGEHAYMAALQRRVLVWIAAHPRAFAWIWVQGSVGLFFRRTSTFRPARPGRAR